MVVQDVGGEEVGKRHELGGGGEIRTICRECSRCTISWAVTDA
jgi:hypothetical protein